VPGATLEVHIERVVPSAWGYTWAGRGITPRTAALGVDDALTLVRWELYPIVVHGMTT